MKIVVCVKQVPDTKGGVKFNPDGTLDRGAMLTIMNPDDKAGLEAALRIKDEYGAEVTVLTMGLPKAEEVLREAMAMGADKGILVTDRVLGGADTWATSTTIAGALRNIDYDLIITGRQAIDGDTAQVGPQIAEHLNLPVISYAQDIKIDGDSVIVQRQAVTLLMASLRKPKLLLLDEHTAALDPKTAKKVLELTEEIVAKDNLTTLMITHNMKDAIRLGNRLIMMHEGKVIYDISGEEKKNLKVADLLAKFEEVSGDELANDRMILS